MEKNQFKQALDVWAQFFISPLMKENTVEREINAVDSEFDLARQDDWCRKLFIMQVSNISIFVDPHLLMNIDNSSNIIHFLECNDGKRPSLPTKWMG